MSTSAKLNLHDIQGNIVKAYSRYGFPTARYVLYHFGSEVAGRGFVVSLVPLITTSAPWSREKRQKLVVTTNVALTFGGLEAAGVPTASLLSFPDEFAMGMEARRDILGDDGPSAPSHWDPVWHVKDQPVHLLVTINGKTIEEIKERYEIIEELALRAEGVVRLDGHGGDDGADDLPYQDASALEVNGRLTPKEHFGFTDGISDPYFKGSETHPANVIGGGRTTGKDPMTMEGWEPLETGEFILGHKDEAFQYPDAPSPRLLSRNGTFLAYRKLHQNVASFKNYLDETAASFPGSREELAAKLAGRWRNGAPITRFPDEDKANAIAAEWSAAKEKIWTAANDDERQAASKVFGELQKQFVGFDFNQDLSGASCPVGAHVRRVNPRGSLEFGKTGAFQTPAALVNRRRILRRGLPYGSVTDDTRDDGNHGIVFMALGASLRRQFEFVQQQWINYGNDFKLSSDKDALLGNHDGDGRMTIEGDPKTGRPPFFCGGMPRFVETRGGEYFFIPSLTALRMIGGGIIDPT